MKKLGALLLIFLGLSAFVYFYEIEGHKTREEAKKLEESLLRFEQEDIVGLELSRFNQQDLVLIREGKEWTIRKPIEAMASKTSLEGLLSSLEGAQRDRIFTVEKDGAKVYGLENPRMALKI